MGRKVERGGCDGENMGRGGMVEDGEIRRGEAEEKIVRGVDEENTYGEKRGGCGVDGKMTFEEKNGKMGITEMGEKVGIREWVKYWHIRWGEESGENTRS